MRNYDKAATFFLQYKDIFMTILLATTQHVRKESQGPRHQTTATLAGDITVYRCIRSMLWNGVAFYRSLNMKLTKIIGATISGLITLSVMADSLPIYTESTGELLIPIADSSTFPGYFQEVRLHSVGDNLWEVIEFREGKLLNVIEVVELITIDSSPAQILLKISGTFTSGCGEIGYIREHLSGTQFDITVFYKNDAWLDNPGEIACTAALRPFSKIIPLRVYGLEQGEYQYAVNNEFTGNFTLTAKND